MLSEKPCIDDQFTMPETLLCTQNNFRKWKEPSDNRSLKAYFMRTNVLVGRGIKKTAFLKAKLTNVWTAA